MIPASLTPIANHVWQSTVFAGAAALLALAMKNYQARVRHTLWLCGSLKFLVPFTVLIAIGGNLGFLWRTSHDSAATPVMIPVMIEDVLSPVAIPEAPPQLVAPSRNWTSEVLSAIWACGFAVVLLKWMREWLRVRAMVRSGVPGAIDCGVAVRSTKALIEPGVFGIFRPVLLLPDGLADRLNAREFASVLAHEMCHVHRRDNLSAAIHMLVGAIFWFHPLVWWMETKMVEERERACDEEVVRSGSEPDVYAGGILKVCEHYLESPAMCVAGVTGSNLKRRIEEIVAGRVALRLGFRKKFLLAMAGIAAVAGPVAIGMIYAPRLRAQPVEEPTKRLPFEVASIKANTRDDPKTVGGEIKILPGGRLSVKNFELWSIIRFAYQLGGGSPGGGPGERLTGGPAWIRTERFDIEGIADKNAIAGDKTFDARADKVHVMLQTLLADRFKLVIRREMREMPVYAIVAAKSGPKFERAKVEEKDCERPVDEGTPQGKPLCHAWDFVRDGGQQLIRRGDAVDMSDLVRSISGTMTDRPVVDKTGLKGLFKIEYVDPKSMEVTGYSTRPSIYEAFEKLGLKLEPQKAPVEMYVIESVERPTAN